MISKIPYFAQERIDTCGIAALRMVLGSFGDLVAEADLLALVPMHSFGTLLTDLGNAALKRGYKVRVHTFHLSLAGDLGLLPGSRITKNILKKKLPGSRDKMTYASWLLFLQNGGELIWGPPKTSLFSQKDVPTIINVNMAALSQYWRHWALGHYLIVDRVTKNDVSVLDPDSTKKQTQYKISNEELVPSWAINASTSSGYLMILSSPEL